MLNQVLKVSSGTCQQFLEDAVKISNTFGFLTFTSYSSNMLQVRWKSLWCIHREFPCELIGQRILKISPRLPKLLSNIKGLTFLGYSVLSTMYRQVDVISCFVCVATDKRNLQQ